MGVVKAGKTGIQPAKDTFWAIPGNFFPISPNIDPTEAQVKAQLGGNYRVEGQKFAHLAKIDDFELKAFAS